MEVFVTYSGTAYHKQGEHYFTGSSKIHVLEKKAKKLGYVPCQHCFPGRKPKIVRAGRDGSKEFRELWGRS